MVISSEVVEHVFLPENILRPLQANPEAEGAVYRLNALSRVPEKCGPSHDRQTGRALYRAVRFWPHKILVPANADGTAERVGV